VDGKTYQLSLRFEREYRPYKMHLEEFTHEQFTGTDTPKAFKSEIRLEDPALKQDRKVLIQMNEPLYYRGETFYQHQFRKSPRVETTVLQVVHNPAWPMPYLSCAMIGGGLLIHFGMSLVTFLRRQL
jgi:cytochrome c biogenesis protein ResB